MTDSFVTVTAAWTTPTPTGNVYGSGNWQAVASGTLMDSSSVALVVPYAAGQLDAVGSLAVVLLASDNFAPGQLNWSFKIQVQGLPDLIASDIPVYASLGSSQGLFGILTAAGFVADST